MMRHAPSNTGFGAGTQLNIDKSGGEKLVVHTAYHHTNEVGLQVGWTEHTVTATPASGFNLKVSGRDRSGVKD